MIEEHKVEKALAFGLSKIEPSSDLLGRITRQAGNPEHRSNLWWRLRPGPKLELAVACILLVSLLGIAAYRNLHSRLAPAGGHAGAQTQELSSETPVHRIYSGEASDGTVRAQVLLEQQGDGDWNVTSTIQNVSSSLQLEFMYECDNLMRINGSLVKRDCYALPSAVLNAGETKTERLVLPGKYQGTPTSGWLVYRTRSEGNQDPDRTLDVPIQEGVRQPSPPSPPSLSELRKEVSFPVFVPTDVARGLTPSIQVNWEKPLIRVSYLRADGTKELSVLNGPAGCCLDAARKVVGPVTIRDNITAHFLVNQPEFGGPILWWQEDGSYIALSGPHLTKEELVRIATSMSSTAVPSPQVRSFEVSTSEGDLQAPAAGYRGEPPGKVVAQPQVILEATVQNADAVRFVIGSLVGRDGPIEQLGPFTPDPSGRVHAEWELRQSGFAYIIRAEAIQKPAVPIREGEAVDSEGNLVGTTGPIRLELGPTE